MNPTLRDGFVTMVSAFVATVFYGAPLVGVALSTGPWAPEVVQDDGDPDGDADDGPRTTVRMMLDLPQQAEAELVVEAAADLPEAPSDADPTDGTDAGPASEAGAAAAAEAENGTVAGEGDAGAGDARKTVRPAGRGAAAKARRQKICDTPHPNVHPRDGFVDIDRSLVDTYTKNLESFMKLGYSRPYDENGIRGWYIAGFGCSSPVHKAGFRRGDVLLSVNGKNTRSWVGVFMLYQKLKSKRDFDIQIVRRGAPVTLKFHIVPG